MVGHSLEVNDAQVIERSLGDGAAFALLFDRHYRRIRRFLGGRVASELADDLASETFTVAFRRRRSYDLSRDDALPWLYGIAVNLLRQHRRSEERRLRAYARMPSDHSSDVGDGVLDPALASALLDLSEPERHLILLFAWADLSYEQLAETMGLPIGTVRSRLARTRAKLRAGLGQLEVEAVWGGEVS